MDDFLGGLGRRGDTAYRLVLYRSDGGDHIRTPDAADGVSGHDHVPDHDLDHDPGRAPERDPDGGAYRFLMPVHGEMLMFRDGAEARLRPGTGGLVSPAAPVRVVPHRPSRAFVLTIPAHEVDGRLHGVVSRAAPLAADLDLSTGLGRVVADMVRAVGEERETLTARQFDAACDRITELLCIVVADFDDPNGARPSGPGHLAEVEAVVRRHVREHATDPGLTGAAMAQDLGWSLRQIQLALQRAGTTPRELIREERLRLVRDRLRNPLDGDVTITDLAHATGFSSASALSHAFRRRFGVSPRELRQRDRRRAAR
ncbi:helix-turn-helix domain-containing protein [Actinomadura spongiicola]|uniref:helix-turn-helix domain-containing protein n=1 Tax=Actinomadura spongiicola TaxID=2303421 RepID=UPI001F3B5929|nr:helix-turn-helix domain-containing protein [Actinomadura spongiicola]